MILYDLRCRKGHVFEAWFRDSAAYDDQAEASEVACPTCGTKKVEKAPMAPRLAKGGLPKGSGGTGEARRAEGPRSRRRCCARRDEGVAFTRIPWAPRQDS